jgi:hypothetical protein
MNRFSAIGFAAAVLVLGPSVSHAGINKCTDAAGVVTYSDRPCASNEGLKPAEVKNTTEFAALAARENEKKVAQECAFINERRSQCNVHIESRLATAFHSGCEVPLKRDYADKTKEQRGYRYGYNRYGSRDNREDGIEDKDKIEARLPCAQLEATVFKFVKENFPTKLSAEEMKAIEYNIIAVPSNGGPQFARRNKPRY